MSLEHAEPWYLVTGTESSQHLESLGLAATILMGAARQGVVATQNVVTAFHPVTARGFMQWSETVASLRAALAELDWTKNDPQNSPRSLSPDGMTSIMVAGGDPATGLDSPEQPRLARRRGAATRAAVQINGQETFDITLAMPRSQVPPNPSTWMLLYHWSRDEPVVRAELSLPVAFDDGHISRWRHRILLPEQDLTEFSIGENTSSPQDEVNFGIGELA